MINAAAGTDDFVLVGEPVHAGATYSRIWIQVE
jgi:hypothetical protein